MNKLPPAAFSNLMNDISPDFDFTNWRKSKEWRIFVAGYNHAVVVVNESIMNQYNLGETVEKVFGTK